MVFYGEPEFPQITAVSLAAAGEQDSYAAILTENPADEAALAALADRLGPNLLLPECWQNVFPQAGVLISSSISGGELHIRFAEAARTFPNRCWLLLEQLCMRFPLPCPSGIGEPVNGPIAENSFYSEALCCRYTHTPEQIILFDTEETLSRKVALAKAAGFCGVVRVDQPISP